MNQTKPVVLIMAGGKGERFWPRSTISHPKQLQKVYSDKTLLEETIDRALTITKRDSIFIGCNSELKKAILKSHKNIKSSQFIVEPEGRNTAPIIALAALQLAEKFPGSTMVVLSADHYISPLYEFKATLERAVSVASDGWLVTLGVRPSRPEVGYGYIQAGEPLSDGAVKIQSFIEKPNLETARSYLGAGDQYFWNSGIFIWQLQRILQEFQNHAPDVLNPLQQCYDSKKKLKEIFPQIPSVPVDKAIMEKSERIAMLPASFVWDDVGAWTALERICEQDANRNVHFTSGKKGRLLAKDSQGNIIVSQKKLVGLLGIEDTILVEEKDVIFVARRDRIDDIKSFLQILKENPSLQKFLR